MPPQLILAALLLITPGLALAEGCTKAKTEANMSCAQGTIWNDQIKACETTSS